MRLAPTWLLLISLIACMPALADERPDSKLSEDPLWKSFTEQGEQLKADPKAIPAELPAALKHAAEATEAAHREAVHKLLKKDSGPVYPRYVRALVVPAAAECVPTLIELLNDPSQHDVAYEALCYIAVTARPLLEELVTEGKPAQRRAAVNCLASLFNPRDVSLPTSVATDNYRSAIAALRKGVEDSDPAVRFDAAKSLHTLHLTDRQILDVFTSDLDVDPDYVLAEAANAARKLTDYRRALQKLMEDSSSLDRRAQAALAMMSIRDQPAKEVARPLLEVVGMYGSEEFRSQQLSIALLDDCIEALGLLPEVKQDSLPLLTKLADASEETASYGKFEANIAIIKLDNAQAEARVAALLPHVSKRGYAARKGQCLLLIASLGPKGRVATDSLSTIISSNSDPHRMAAALTLLCIAPEKADEAFDVIRKIVKGELQGHIGIAAFKNIGGVARPVVPDLIAALGTEPQEKQGLAIDLLGIIGSGAVDALPTLEQEFDKESDDRRKSKLREAIRRIKSSNP